MMMVMMMVYNHHDLRLRRNRNCCKGEGKN